MEQCPVCGAATRPGAKFCTSCGSRIDDAPKADATQETQLAAPPVDASAPHATVASTSSWSAPANADDDATQETTWSAPASTDGDAETDATQETTWAAPASASDDAARDDEETPAWSSSWSGSGSTASSTTDPASRFEAALDNDESGDQESTTWTWRSGSDTGSTAEAPAAAEDMAETGEAAPATAGAWSTPISSMGDDDDEAVAEATEAAATPENEPDMDVEVEPTPAATEIAATDTAGFSSAGEVDFLSGDESVDDAVLATAASGGDARKRASALLDEARRLIWTIGDETAASTGSRSIINNIKRVRADTADFSDLRAVIDAARENPRDIDALRDLADHANRLSDLLDSHARLTVALEDALSDEP